MLDVGHWMFSVVVSMFALFSEVNRHWARLLLRWVTVCGELNHEPRYLSQLGSLLVNSCSD